MDPRTLLSRKIDFLTCLFLSSGEEILEHTDYKSMSIRNKYNLLFTKYSESKKLTSDGYNEKINDLIRECDDLSYEFIKPLHIIATIYESQKNPPLKPERPIPHVISDLLKLQTSFEEVDTSQKTLFKDVDNAESRFVSKFKSLRDELSKLPFKNLADYNSLYKTKEISTEIKNKPVIPKKTLDTTQNMSFFLGKSTQKDSKHIATVEKTLEDITMDLAIDSLNQQCNDYLIYTRNKLKNNTTHKERAQNKEEKVSILLAILNAKKTQSRQKITEFNISYLQFRSALRNPTNTFGESHGEKFTNQVDRILLPLVANKNRHNVAIKK
jgi:hypothetical protein